MAARLRLIICEEKHPNDFELASLRINEMAPVEPNPMDSGNRKTVGKMMAAI